MRLLHNHHYSVTFAKKKTTISPFGPPPKWSCQFLSRDRTNKMEAPRVLALQSAAHHRTTVCSGTSGRWRRSTAPEMKKKDGSHCHQITSSADSFLDNERHGRWVSEQPTTPPILQSLHLTSIGRQTKWRGKHGKIGNFSVLKHM